MVFSPAELLSMVSATHFKVMSSNDRMAFSGVESIDAKIGDYGDYILILDGDILAIIDEDGNEQHYTMDLAE